jgi:hypothetical protein
VYCNDFCAIVWLTTSSDVIIFNTPFFSIPPKMQDMFEMGPSEVIKFCTECVLSDDEEPCDVPQSMFGSNDDAGLRP